MQHANPRTALAKWKGKGKKDGEEWGGWGGEAEREFTRPRGEELGWNWRGVGWEVEGKGEGHGEVGNEGDEDGDGRDVGEGVEVEGSPNGESLYESGSDLSMKALEELKILREGHRRRRAVRLCGRQEKGQRDQFEDESVAARPVQVEEVSEAWWTDFQGKTNDVKPECKCKWGKKAKGVFSKTKNFLVKWTI